MLSNSLGMTFTINNQQFQLEYQYSKDSKSYFQLIKLQYQNLSSKTLFITNLIIDIYNNIHFLINLLMAEIKKFLNESKSQILIGLLGLAAAGALGYWYFNRKSKNDEFFEERIPYGDELAIRGSVSSDNSENKSTQQVSITQSTQRRYARVIHQCRTILDANGNNINSEVIQAIISGQYQLARDQINQLVQKSRAQRRAKFTDLIQYSKIVTQAQILREQIQEKHLGSILSRFNIDKATWKEACDSQEKNQQRNFNDIIQQEEIKQLESLLTDKSKPLTFEIIKDILKHKIECLKSLNPNQLGLQFAADEATRYNIIENYVYDCIYNKFRVQEELFEYSINILSKEEKQQVATIEDQVFEALESHLEPFREDQDQQDYF